MDVILHLGAHRTGTTTFQDYMRRYSGQLEAGGVGFWGPALTRKGLYSGLIPKPHVARGRRDLQARAEGRIALRLARAERQGLTSLVVSDENMLGTIRDNLRRQSLYPGAGERMARFARAFDGRLSRVVLCIRSLENFWMSGIAYGVTRGLPVPDDFRLRKIAAGRRSWRDVITDLHCALPNVDIRVLAFESFAGRPDALLHAGARIDAPPDTGKRWLNRAPSVPEMRALLDERGTPDERLPKDAERWCLFSADMRATLRRRYAEDIAWLTRGADGLATMTEDRARSRTGQSPLPGTQWKGHTHERTEGYLAQTC